MKLGFQKICCPQINASKRFRTSIQIVGGLVGMWRSFASPAEIALQSPLPQRVQGFQPCKKIYSLATNLCH
jgi:hypothetical protein